MRTPVYVYVPFPFIWHEVCATLANILEVVFRSMAWPSFNERSLLLVSKLWTDWYSISQGSCVCFELCRVLWWFKTGRSPQYLSGLGYWYKKHCAHTFGYTQLFLPLILSHYKNLSKWLMILYQIYYVAISAWCTERCQTLKRKDGLLQSV